jgi:hypothetical protein
LEREIERQPSSIGLPVSEASRPKVKTNCKLMFLIQLLSSNCSSLMKFRQLEEIAHFPPVRGAENWQTARLLPLADNFGFSLIAVMNARERRAS